MIPMQKAVFADAPILLVDDDANNLTTFTRLLNVVGYRHVITTTDPGAVPALYAEHDPDLVLIDWHMPGHGGATVLAELRAAVAPLTYLPIVVLTGDTTPTVRREALAAGATDFLTKPFEVDEVLLRIRNLLETRHLHREITRHNRTLEARVAERTAELEDAQLDSLERLALAAEFRDDETGRHTERVGEAAALLAESLGLDGNECFVLRRAAPLHDIGKIGIPDAVLRKPGPLSADEVVIMQQHAAIGARLLAGGRSHIMRLAEQIAQFHHEAWDGSGYPNGRAGEAIPLAARIVSVADVFDALSSNRVYRRAWAPERVLEYIASRSGQQFDPAVAVLCTQDAVRRGLVAIRLRAAGPGPVHAEHLRRA